MYLQCPSGKSRTAIIGFYLLCLLYVLSMATVVCDLLTFILQEQVVSIRLSAMHQCVLTRSPPTQFYNATGLSFGVSTVQVIANSCCDFIAQCILVGINLYHPFIYLNLQKIYRCWIVWGKDIRAVIIPIMLSITYVGQ